MALTREEDWGKRSREGDGRAKRSRGRCLVDTVADKSNVDADVDVVCESVQDGLEGAATGVFLFPTFEL